MYENVRQERSTQNDGYIYKKNDVVERNGFGTKKFSVLNFVLLRSLYYELSFWIRSTSDKNETNWFLIKSFSA